MNIRCTQTRRSLFVGFIGVAYATLVETTAAQAASARQIDADASQALRTLYSTQPKARDMGNRAKAILIFPKIYKGGLIIGGQTGDGALREGGKTVGYYNISAASFGL
jgi:lipid-binding SYLF domain-containing protein